MKTILLRYLFLKTAYSKHFILCKTAYLMQNNLLRSLFKKQLIQNNLFFEKPLTTFSFQNNLFYAIQFITISF